MMPMMVNTALNASMVAPQIRTQLTSGVQMDYTLVGRLAAAASWAKAQEVLSKLRFLGDDWDGEGSRAPALANIAAAFELLRRLSEESPAGPAPQVVAGGCGEVMLVWQSPSYYLEAEIASPNRVEWMRRVLGEPGQHWNTDLLPRPQRQPYDPGTATPGPQTTPPEAHPQCGAVTSVLVEAA